MVSARKAFAQVIQTLQPYAQDIVVVGGWVHALLLASDNDSATPVLTDDIDITIPRHLPAGTRPTLLELAAIAGFERDPLSDIEGSVVRLIAQGPFGTIIDLDLLTESEMPRSAVSIDGQLELAVQGYPGQQFLMDNTQWIEVGQEIDDSLNPPVRIRIPTVAAYVVHKGLSSASRTLPGKSAKDLVYVFELLRHPKLGRQAREELASLRPEYSDMLARWRAHVANVLNRNALLNEMAQQLLYSDMAIGPTEDIVARIKTVFRRHISDSG